MSDLMPFYGVTVGGAAALVLHTPRATNTFDFIKLDKGMVAKIWSLQLEGIGIGKVVLQYLLEGDPTDPAAVWADFKGFSKPKADKAERWKYTSRPLIIEAWNDTTYIRVLEDGAYGVADLELTMEIEFEEMAKQ